MFRRSAVGGQRLLWRLVVCLAGTLGVSVAAAGFQPLLAEDCVNGMDDDGDLLIDCDDPDCAAVDDDGDGVLLCAGDCDDRNASVWGAPSAIDGVPEGWARALGRRGSLGA